MFNVVYKLDSSYTSYLHNISYWKSNNFVYSWEIYSHLIRLLYFFSRNFASSFQMSMKIDFCWHGNKWIRRISNVIGRVWQYTPWYIQRREPLWLSNYWPQFTPVLLYKDWTNSQRSLQFWIRLGLLLGLGKKNLTCSHQSSHAIVASTTGS